MDEQLFLLVAKLKADQRKLERERLALGAVAPQPARGEAPAPRDVRGHGELVSKLQWREQS